MTTTIDLKEEFDDIKSADAVRKKLAKADISEEDITAAIKWVRSESRAQ